MTDRELAGCPTWMAVPGWGGMYEVSDGGLIRSVDRLLSNGRRMKGRVLRPKKNNRGYLCVNLQDGWSGRRVMLTVHRLVALAFIPNDQNLPQVNHIDGVKVNCRASNLEWASAADNSIHSTARRLNPVPKFTDAEIANIRLRALAGERPIDMAREFGIHRSRVSAIVRGETYAWVESGDAITGT